MTLVGCLTTIRFDRETTTGEPAAIPVASHAEGPESEFDWTRGTSGYEGCVAYPKSAGSLPLTITVQIELPVAASAPFYIRASTTGTSPLGDPCQVQLTASGELIRTAILALSKSQLSEAAVGLFRFEWTWEFSTDGVNWSGSEQTLHAVYVLVDRPALPWGRAGNSKTVVPWVDPVDLACEWAKGETTGAGASRAITAAVFGLGEERPGKAAIEYGGGVSDYASIQQLQDGSFIDVFYLSEFIKLVRVDPGYSTSLSCEDTASVVALMGALLGCPLRIKRLYPRLNRGDTFRTNPVVLLGSENCRWEDFHYHEVAFETVVGDDFVWDACLQIDLDSRPGRKPFTGGLANQERLDSAGKGISYKARLLQPLYLRCGTGDVGDHGLRYPAVVSSGTESGQRPGEVELRAFYRALLAGLRPHILSTPIAAGAVLPFVAGPAGFESSAFAVWTGGGYEPFQMLKAKVSPVDAPDSTLRIAAVITGSHEPKDVLLQMAVSFSVPLELYPGIGDYCLYCRRFDSILFVRRGVVVRAINDAVHPVRILDAARQLDSVLQALPG